MNVIEKRVSLVSLTFEEIKEIAFALEKLEEQKYYDSTMRMKLLGSFELLLRDLRNDYE